MKISRLAVVVPAVPSLKRPRRILCIAFFLLVAGTHATMAQAARKGGATPAREAATTTPSESTATVPAVVDIHGAPYRAGSYWSANISNGRFDLRNATVLDLIAVAFERDRDDATILGGPTWLELDRFDLVARIDSLHAPKSNPVINGSPSQSAPVLGSMDANPYDKIRPVLKDVLANRFHLVTHEEDRPLPAYVMRVAKSGTKLAETKQPSDSPSCRGAQDKANPQQSVLTCSSMTLAQFLNNFGSVYSHKVVDNTGLTKTYDFTMNLNFSEIRTRDDYARAITNSLRDQLGLIISEETVPQPALVVDKVDRKPTPNVPDIGKMIPSLPDLEFEVASIRPSAEGEPQGAIRPAGSQITFTGLLQELIVRAWNLTTGASLGDALDGMPKQRYTVVVKLPPDLDARAVWQDQDQVNAMLQKLLVDRFQIKYHWADQLRLGYVLLPGTPKMKKADPTSRTFCKQGPAWGEKNMVTGDSGYDREFHCQNVTMDQFADLLQSVAGVEMKTRVPNKTGVEGAYDFSVYYTTGHKMRVDAQLATQTAKPEEAGSAATPTTALLIGDAFHKELGLKLEQQKQMLPTLILDHYEKTPTEN